VTGIAQAVIDFLVEERCHACGEMVDDATDAAPSHPASRALARPVEASGVGRWRIRSRLLCGACVARVAVCDHPVDVGDAAGPLAVFPAFSTDARLLSVIHLLKFGRRECVAPWLALAMASGLPAAARRAGAVLVPVPMDAAARRRRGFNQAERIARRLAREWALPLAAGALTKPAGTAAQSMLGRAERERNLAAAFRLGRPVIAGRPALLVDDLVTSGATARACAGVLRAAGAADIRVLCAGYRPWRTEAFPQS